MTFLCGPPGKGGREGEMPEARGAKRLLDRRVAILSDTPLTLPRRPNRPIRGDQEIDTDACIDSILNANDSGFDCSK